MPLAYSLARGNATAGLLECQYTLLASWRPEALRAAGHNERAMRACGEMASAYAADLSAAERDALCWGLPKYGAGRRTLCRRALGVAGHTHGVQ